MSRTRYWQVGLLLILGLILLALLVNLFSLVTPEQSLGAAFSADGALLARSTESGVGVFDVRSGWLKRQLSVGLGHVAFSPDARLLITGDKTHLTVWDWAEGKLLFSHQGQIGVRLAFHVAVSSDGTKVAGADDHSLRVWGLPGGALLMTVPLHHDHDYLAFTPDSKFVIAGGEEQKAAGKPHHEVKLWAVPGGELHATLVGPDCRANGVAVSSDGKTLATGHSTGSVRLWDIGTRTELWNAAEVPVDGDALAFSPDGKALVVCGWGEATVFDIAEPKSRRTFRLPVGYVETVSPGPEDGQFLVAVEQQVFLLDGATGEVSGISSGLGFRPRLPFWVVGVTVLVWLVFWAMVNCHLGSGLPDEVVPGERLTWAAVPLTALGSFGHWALWALMVEIEWRDWEMANPFLVASGLTMLGLVALFVLVPLGVVCLRRPYCLHNIAFCVTAVSGQLLFDGYVLCSCFSS